MAKGASLHVDRDRFLLILMAMAAPGCNNPSPGEAPPVAAPLVIGSVTPPPPEPPEAPPALPRASAAPASSDAPPTPVSECEKENEKGVVDCSLLKARKLSGPSCEGVRENCDFLARGDSYRARPARVAVECMGRLSNASCSMAAKRKCFEEGIRAACADPAYEAACESKMNECRAARVRVEYTKEQCVKVMSALKDRERSWAIQAMGPSSEGKCKLMFVVY